MWLILGSPTSSDLSASSCRLHVGCRVQRAHTCVPYRRAFCKGPYRDFVGCCGLRCGLFLMRVLMETLVAVDALCQDPGQRSCALAWPSALHAPLLCALCQSGAPCQGPHWHALHMVSTPARMLMPCLNTKQPCTYAHAVPQWRAHLLMLTPCLNRKQPCTYAHAVPRWRAHLLMLTPCLNREQPCTYAHAVPQWRAHLLMLTPCLNTKQPCTYAHTVHLWRAHLLMLTPCLNGKHTCTHLHCA